MRVGLLTEGGYPYANGAAGLWCDRLVRALVQHEFAVCALSRSAGQEAAGCLPLPDQVRRVRTAPLWGPPPYASMAGAARPYRRRERVRFAEHFGQLVRALSATTLSPPGGAGASSPPGGATVGGPPRAVAPRGGSTPAGAPGSGQPRTAPAGSTRAGSTASPGRPEAAAPTPTAHVPTASALTASAPTTFSPAAPAPTRHAPTATAPHGPSAEGPGAGARERDGRVGGARWDETAAGVVGGPVPWEGAAVPAVGAAADPDPGADFGRGFGPGVAGGAEPGVPGGFAARVHRRPPQADRFATVGQFAPGPAPAQPGTGYAVPAHTFADGFYGLAELARECGGLATAIRSDLVLRLLAAACRAPGAMADAQRATVPDLLAVLRYLERALRPLSRDWYGATARARALELFTVEQNAAAFRGTYLELTSHAPACGRAGEAGAADGPVPFAHPAEALVPGCWATVDPAPARPRPGRSTPRWARSGPAAPPYAAEAGAARTEVVEAPRGRSREREGDDA